MNTIPRYYQEIYRMRNPISCYESDGKLYWNEALKYSEIEKRTGINKKKIYSICTLVKKIAIRKCFDKRTYQLLFQSKHSA